MCAHIHVHMHSRKKTPAAQHRDRYAALLTPVRTSMITTIAIANDLTILIAVTTAVSTTIMIFLHLRHSCHRYRHSLIPSIPPPSPILLPL